MNDFYHSPPSYDSFSTKLNSLKNQFDFIDINIIGKSVLSKNIYSIGIGNMENINLFVGTVHASEWLTCSLLVKFIEALCQKLTHNINDSKHIKLSLDKKGALFIPLLNPDGLEIATKGAISAQNKSEFVEMILANSPNMVWQANANGIDLNHNFDAGFSLCKKSEQEHGYTKPSPRFYGGISPHNQPESKALVDLCLKENIKTAFAFHSQGEEIFYEYGENTPAQSFFIASLLASYSGYSICKQTGTASHGGFKDWFIEKLHRPAFTIEIGKGENPLPISDLDCVYNQLEEMLVVSLFV